MKAAQAVIDGFDQKQLAVLMGGNNLNIEIEGEQYILTPEDVEVERQVREGMIAANDGHITIALDTLLTEELLIEGLARELVNKINSTRREMGLDVTDRITIKMETSDRVKACLQQHGDYIRNEVLAVAVDFGKCEGAVWDLNGEPARALIEKICC